MSARDLAATVRDALLVGAEAVRMCGGDASEANPALTALAVLEKQAADAQEHDGDLQEQVSLAVTGQAVDDAMAYVEAREQLLGTDDPLAVFHATVFELRAALAAAGAGRRIASSTGHSEPRSPRSVLLRSSPMAEHSARDLAAIAQEALDPRWPKPDEATAYRAMDALAVLERQAADAQDEVDLLRGSVGRLHERAVRAEEALRQIAEGRYPLASGIAKDFLAAAGADTAPPEDS